MRKRRWLPKSPSTADVTDPKTRRLLSMERKKHKREIERLKKLVYNARRREWRMQERLRESHTQNQEASEAVGEQYEGRLEEWRKEKASLKRNITRLNARDRRGPSRTQHAVQRALAHSDTSGVAAQPIVRYVKDKYGVVQEWARNTILTLVNQGIAMSKTWAVAEATAKGLGVMIDGTWSPRTSRRVVREGAIAAGLMIVEHLLMCVGQ